MRGAGQDRMGGSGPPAPVVHSWVRVRGHYWLADLPRVACRHKLLSRGRSRLASLLWWGRVKLVAGEGPSLHLPTLGPSSC